MEVSFGYIGENAVLSQAGTLVFAGLAAAFVFAGLAAAG
jgi:hypothetical protein